MDEGSIENYVCTSNEGIKYFGGPSKINYFDNNIYFSDISLAANNPQKNHGMYVANGEDISNVSLIEASDYGFVGVSRSNDSSFLYTMRMLGVTNDEFSPSDPASDWDVSNLDFNYVTTSSIEDSSAYDTSQYRSSFANGSMISDIEFDNQGNVWHSQFDNIRAKYADDVSIAIVNQSSELIGRIMFNNSYYLVTSINKGGFNNEYMYITFAENIFNGGSGFVMRIKLYMDATTMTPQESTSTTMGTTMDTTMGDDDDASKLTNQLLIVFLVSIGALQLLFVSL